MNSHDIWIVFTKSRPLPGCDIDFDDCEFYFSEAFVPTSGSGELLNTFEEILRKVRNGLLDKKFELIDVSKIIRFDQKHWEVIDDNANELIAHAREFVSIKGIVFSGFRSEEVEGETKYKHIVSNPD